MTYAERFKAKTLHAITKVGASGTLTVPSGTYNVDGTVTEDATSVAVTLGGPVNEQKRPSGTGADYRVTATFYISAEGLTVVPTTSCRLSLGSRTFTCYSCQPYSINGTTVAYELDVGEVGT